MTERPTVRVARLGGYDTVHMVSSWSREGTGRAACNMTIRFPSFSEGHMSDVTCRSCQRSGYGQPALDADREWMGYATVRITDLIGLRDQLDELIRGAS